MRRPNLPILLAAAALAGLSACTRVPELESRLDTDLRNAKYPMLIPLGANVAPLTDPAEESEKLQQELDARSSRLQARASALKSAPE